MATLMTPEEQVAHHKREAADEMYEALKLFLERYDGIRDEDLHIIATEPMVVAIRAARVAVAKAEGAI